MTEYLDEEPKSNNTRRMDDPRPNKSGVMFIVAMVTLFQGLFFYGISYIDNRITILPKDPIALIGVSYVVMGLLFMLISRHMTIRGKQCACGIFWRGRPQSSGCNRTATVDQGNNERDINAATEGTGTTNKTMNMETERTENDSTDRSEEFEKVDADIKKLN